MTQWPVTPARISQDQATKEKGKSPEFVVRATGRAPPSTTASLLCLPVPLPRAFSSWLPLRSLHRRRSELQLCPPRAAQAAPLSSACSRSPCIWAMLYHRLFSSPWSCVPAPSASCPSHHNQSIKAGPVIEMNASPVPANIRDPPTSVSASRPVRRVAQGGVLAWLTPLSVLEARGPQVSPGSNRQADRQKVGEEPLQIFSARFCSIPVLHCHLQGTRALRDDQRVRGQLPEPHNHPHNQSI